jgi:sec-independent protein translocase protein TatA
MHTLLFFEFLGTSELLVILVVALVIFGPRKLPELGRSLGGALHQFKAASDDFRRTWETEALLVNGGAPAFVRAGDVSAEGLSPEAVNGPATEATAADGEDSSPREDTTRPDDVPATAAPDEGRA